MLDKRLSYCTVISALMLAPKLSLAESAQHYRAQSNARHQALKAVIFATPYESLPYYKVNKAQFKNKNNRSESRLLSDAHRTLADTRDLLDEDRGQKLLQANGICFSGEWIIDHESTYSGVFSQATSIPVIARASASFSGTKQTERRALGMAVKLLPDDLAASPSLNVFTLHTVGGVKTKYVLDLSLDNEPPLGRIPRFQDIPTALKLRKELLKADKEAGSEKPSVTFRSISALAAHNATSVKVPRWIRFNAAQDARIDRLDFRDELRVENYDNGQLIYHIDVGNHPELKKSKAHWQRIGRLVFNQSVTSKACDTRLHFAHPKN